MVVLSYEFTRLTIRKHDPSYKDTLLCGLPIVLASIGVQVGTGINLVFAPLLAFAISVLLRFSLPFFFELAPKPFHRVEELPGMKDVRKIFGPLVEERKKELKDELPKILTRLEESKRPEPAEPFETVIKSEELDIKPLEIVRCGKKIKPFEKETNEL